MSRERALTIDEYKIRYHHKQRHFADILDQMRDTDNDDLIQALEDRMRVILRK